MTLDSAEATAKLMQERTRVSTELGLLAGQEAQLEADLRGLLEQAQEQFGVMAMTELEKLLQQEQDRYESAMQLFETKLSEITHNV